MLSSRFLYFLYFSRTAMPAALSRPVMAGQLNYLKVVEDLRATRSRKQRPPEDPASPGVVPKLRTSCRKMLRESGNIWPILADAGQSLAKLGQNCAKPQPNLAKLDQTPPIAVQFGQSLADIGRTLPDVAQTDQSLAKFVCSCLLNAATTTADTTTIHRGREARQA